MPALETQLKELTEATAKLQDQIFNEETGIKAAILKELGTADEKQKVNNMVEANAKAVDDLKKLTEEIRQEQRDRQDEFETKFSRQDSGTPSDDYAEFVKSFNEAGAPAAAKEYVREGSPSSMRMLLKTGVAGNIGAGSIFRKSAKTVTSLSTSAGDAQIPVYEPQIVAPGEQAITLLDLLPRTMTNSPLVYWVVEVLGSRTTSVDIQSLDFTGTDQGTAFGTSDFVFNQLSAETRTFGTIVKLAIQVMEDVPQLRGYIENRLRYMVRYDLEGQVFNGAGTGKNINGLKTQATAFDTTLDTAVGVTNQQNLDVLRLAAHQCNLTYFPATGFFLHPTDVVGLELLKDGQQSYIWANPTNGNGIRPWGLPVAQSVQQTAGDFLCGAFNQCELVIRKDIEVLISTENEDDFKKHLATLKAFGRFGLKAYQPTALIEGDFTSAKA